MKKILVISLGVLLYLRGLVHGYVTPMLGGWMFATALLYILMHYVTLSWREFVHRNGILISVYVAAVTIVIIIATKNVWIALSALLRHAALLSVVYSLEEVLNNRRKFKMTEFFQTGGALFSIFFTLSFITGFLGRNQEFTLTCDQILRSSTAVVNYSEEKLNFGLDTINNWGNSAIDGLFGESALQSTGELSDDTADNDTNENYDTGSILGTLQMYRQQLIDETISNQKDINRQVCQVFIDQIKDMYEKPGFRISVIILMFLVISPLLRITLYIISGLNMLIFLGLKKGKVYEMKKVSVEVDKIV